MRNKKHKHVIRSGLSKKIQESLQNVFTEICGERLPKIILNIESRLATDLSTPEAIGGGEDGLSSRTPLHSFCLAVRCAVRSTSVLMGERPQCLANVSFTFASAKERGAAPM